MRMCTRTLESIRNLEGRCKAFTRAARAPAARLGPAPRVYNHARAVCVPPRVGCLPPFVLACTARRHGRTATARPKTMGEPRPDGPASSFARAGQRARCWQAMRWHASGRFRGTEIVIRRASRDGEKAAAAAVAAKEWRTLHAREREGPSEEFIRWNFV